MDTVKPTILKLLETIGYTDATVEEVEVAGQHVFSIHTQADPRELIGPHGDTIHAIDHMVKKLVEKKAAAQEKTEEREPMFLVDVDGYRTKHIKDLQAKAKMMAERARSLQYDVELSPMSAYERLIVHTALAEEPHVRTESQGEGRSRRVVIKYSAQ